MPLYDHTIVVPGNLDGVHLGHQALLRHARQLADTLGGNVTALTLDPHPSMLLMPDRTPPLLTTIERKVELLKHYGADKVCVETFDEAFSKLSPQDFIDQILVKKLRAKAVVLGPDFRFGAARQGTIETLRTFGENLGFKVHQMPIEEVNKEPISSTEIRHALKRGEVAVAARWLGRAYDLQGIVAHGAKRGRAIGFPTANLENICTLLPADGVYATISRRMGEPRSHLLFGVANVGERPTFAAPSAVEVHLFDVTDTFYGEPLRVAFLERLRAQQSFAGIHELRAQILMDCEYAKTVLAEKIPLCSTL
ncbi:MAG: bifunctional riboflavin kinase/FAD synthetase [Myxococcales bacterium]|nr:bifunctional riboflavin kinase/FAD synthetase [Myxococcales bacterium]